MKKIFILMLGCTMLQIVGCSTFNSYDNQPQGNRVESGSKAIGGKLEYAMDENDNKNLSQALDKGLGKTTEWVNGRTNIKYIVVPVSKLSVDGNPYCRRYRVTAIANDKERTMHGTACVSLVDSSWRVIGS